MPGMEGDKQADNNVGRHKAPALPKSFHRLQWSEVPRDVRARIEVLLGSGIVSMSTHQSGYSPSLAASCLLEDGRNVFIKAASPAENPSSPDMLRHEIMVCRQMPSNFPAPKLLDAFDDGHWVAAVFEHVRGTAPSVPWRDEELDLVLDSLDEMSALATPSPVQGLTPLATKLQDSFSGWRKLSQDKSKLAALDPWAARNLSALVELESRWAQGAAGDGLVHCDIRDDNVIIDTENRVFFVDWANAAIGATWVDTILMAPSVTLGGGPSAQALWTKRPAAQTVPRDDVTAVVAALAGYFTYGSLLPDPPGLPTLRRFQAEQAAVAREWVAHRTGLQ